MQPSRAAAVDLHWIPFDAGGHFVSLNRRVFEAIEAARHHRQQYAVSSEAPAGTVPRLDAAAKPRPTTVARGATHALGLTETIELARTIDRLPPQLIVYGIEEEDFRAGGELSAPARAAVVAVRLELRERLVTS